MRQRAFGIKEKIGNHTFGATGITAYTKNGGRLEAAQHVANHESPTTTKLYDRREGRDFLVAEFVDRRAPESVAIALQIHMLGLA